MADMDKDKKSRRIGKDHSERLEANKKKVETWYEYFRDNNNRYWDFTKFVCASSLSGSDIAVLNTLQKPTVQFNILEAMVSRLRTEFAQQEPSMVVRAADGVPVEMLTEEFLATEEVVESYLRAIFNDASNDNMQSNINSEQLIGGFSAVWVRTDYVNCYSFEQQIIVEKVFDPTMTFFDPMARTSHKGDGAFCGMLIPYTRARFVEEFGEAAAEDIKFDVSSNLAGFQWSYKNEVEEVVLVAYMFEKKMKRVKIVRLSNGHVVPVDQYKKLIELWDVIEQAPIILEERWTDVETIEQVRFTENKELYRGVTDYKYLPIIFVDGNSVLIKGDANIGSSSFMSNMTAGATQQMTRPYVYHARDAQRSMNLSGQTMMNEIENMVMNKWVASVEGIPTDYQGAYQNPQEAAVLLYNAFDDKTGERLEPPREVQRTPTPPIVESSFMNAQAVIQATLGSYDASQGIVGDNLSGKAIMQGALQSDGASGPYRTNYLKAWERIGLVTMDLIPKYYRTPRSLPVVGRDGKRGFRMVNNPGAEDNVTLNYDASMLQLKIEAGVNSSIQKQMSLEMIVKLSQSSEIFSQFINTKGLSVLLDNLEVRNIDTLKAKAVEFEEEQRAQAEAMADQPSPEEMQLQAITQVEMAKVEQRTQEAEMDFTVKTAEVAIDQEKVELERMKTMAEIEEMGIKLDLEKDRISAENARTAIELALDVAEMQAENNED
jgi:hypothetical protein